MTSSPETSVAAPARSPAQADRETQVRYALDSLHISLEAARLALDMAREAPSRLYGEPTAAQILDAWRAHTLLLYGAVDNLYGDGCYTLNVVRLMLDQD